MPKIVVVEKTGTLKTISIKDFAENTLYKKVGLKSGEGFLLQHTWGAEDGIDQSIRLYGKKTGRAGQENKYDFPPPVDEALFFGPCVLVGFDSKTGAVVDLTDDDWEEIYEYLFGGFEDIGSSDESDDEEDVNTDDELEAMQKQNGVVVKQTKEGYVKDGFIVEDGDEEEEEDASDDDEESEATPPPKKGRKSAVAKNVVKSIAVVAAPVGDLNVDDCESELSEESYD